MMKLLVDMGNSSLKWATVSQGVISQAQFLSYDKLEHELALQWRTLEKPQSIIVSCVTYDQHMDALHQLTIDLWDITAEQIVSPVQGNGVVSAYQRPENLGTDRWAALVGAHALYDKDACIVDCGSALNVELLLADGQHLGGVIVPGVEMMQSNLRVKTGVISKSIPQPLENEESEYWGRDTQSCIIKGSWQALAGAVKQVYHQFEKQADRPICVLCGGGAQQLARYLDMEVEFQPDLVLKGLAIMAGEKITQ